MLFQKLLKRKCNQIVRIIVHNKLNVILQNSATNQIVSKNRSKDYRSALIKHIAKSKHKRISVIPVEKIKSICRMSPYVIAFVVHTYR